MPYNNRITIENIARIVGMNESTVSRALNDSALISEYTKIRIREVAKKLGYRPNILARSLATRTTNLIGFVVSDIKNPFCSEIIEYLEESAVSQGCAVLLSITNNDLKKQEEFIHALVDRRVDGIIINHPQSYTNCQWVKELQREKFPFVLLGWIKGR